MLSLGALVLLKFRIVEKNLQIHDSEEQISSMNKVVFLSCLKKKNKPNLKKKEDSNFLPLCCFFSVPQTYFHSIM